MTIQPSRLGVLTAALLFTVSLGAANVMAAPDAEPTPPKSDGKDKKGSGKKFDESFREGYRAAYAAIYQRGDFAGGLAQLQALGRDDRADVANLIGYANRKLGNYQVAQVWYERALKADPGHVRTWQYYGLWQLERGNREQAQYHLNRIASLCGKGCAEYRSLAEALDQPPGSGVVY